MVFIHTVETSNTHYGWWWILHFCFVEIDHGLTQYTESIALF